MRDPPKRSFALVLTSVLDVLLLPLTIAGAIWLKAIRRIGVQRMPISKRVFISVGVFPVRDHYYEPMFDPRHLDRPLGDPRALPGIDLDIAGQLALLEKFTYREELTGFGLEPDGSDEYWYHNGMFESGDAEFLYSVIRHFKPRRIVEIGSGHSTRMAIAALRRNAADDPEYACDHVCVEPYEAEWLEERPVRTIRTRVEQVGVSLFESLEANDVLFIDSSHVIRPQGDVLFEYLRLLPCLAPGVLVHVHDIFTPRDYPTAWLVDEVRLWNEQYLLEAFLSCNSRFKVIGALNHLAHEFPDALCAACPVLRSEIESKEPGSFWILKLPDPTR